MSAIFFRTKQWIISKIGRERSPEADSVAIFLVRKAAASSAQHDFIEAL
jgi:hypothetical protein